MGYLLNWLKHFKRLMRHRFATLVCLCAKYFCCDIISYAVSEHEPNADDTVVCEPSLNLFDFNIANRNVFFRQDILKRQVVLTRLVIMWLIWQHDHVLIV